MTHTIYAVMLSLFTITHCATAAQQKPQEQPSDAQKAKWEADAQRFARATTAMGGKMLHPDKKTTTEQKDKPKITDIPTSTTDVRARL